MDRIGVVSWGLLPEDDAGLKQALILYDHLWVPWLEESFPSEESIKEWDLDRNRVETLRWLAETGLLKAPEIELSAVDEDEVTSDLRELLRESESVANQTFDTTEEAAKAAGAATFNIDIAVTRLTAYLAWRDHQRLVYPVNFPFVSTDLIPDRIGRTQSVLNVVIKNLPTPSPTVSLQDIVDFRKDPDTRYKFDLLWQWIRKTSNQGLAVHEVEEELQWLLSDYERQVRQLSKEVKRANLKTWIVTPLEMLEDLAKIRWGKLAERLFDFGVTNISAADRELEFTGREMAFVLDAKAVLTDGTASRR